MTIMTPNELRKKGMDALTKALGPVGMAKFLQQHEIGIGDYTQERKNWLKEDIDEIIGEIKKKIFLNNVVDFAQTLKKDKVDFDLHVLHPFLLP